MIFIRSGTCRCSILSPSLFPCIPMPGCDWKGKFPSISVKSKNNVRKYVQTMMMFLLGAIIMINNHTLKEQVSNITVN